jgi:hypothetical protein
VAEYCEHSNKPSGPNKHAVSYKLNDYQIFMKDLFKQLITLDPTEFTLAFMVKMLFCKRTMFSFMCSKLNNLIGSLTDEPGGQVRRKTWPSFLAVLKVD